jgi:hypothetical protein
VSFKYKGDLLKPMEPPVIGLLMDDEDIAKIAQAEVKEKYRRMILLFDAHSVEHGNWEGLCFALAESHIPGFKMAKGRAGRAKKWQEYDRAQLVLAVEETGLNITEATKLLATKEPWKTLISHSRGAAALRDEFTRADPRMVEVCRDAKKYGDLQRESARNS